MIHLVRITSDICEDSYHGGMGKCTGAGLNERVGKTFEDKAEMLKWLHKNYDLPKDENDYEENDANRHPILETHKMVSDKTEYQNGGWMEPTKQEYDLWKKGKMTLYTETYMIEYLEVMDKNKIASEIPKKVLKAFDKYREGLILDRPYKVEEDLGDHLVVSSKTKDGFGLQYHLIRSADKGKDRPLAVRIHWKNKKITLYSDFIKEFNESENTLSMLRGREASAGEITPKSVKELISEWETIEKAVKKLSDLYEKHDFNEHDLGFAPKIIPMSLDEWHHEIGSYIEKWEKELNGMSKKSSTQSDIDALELRLAGGYATNNRGRKLYDTKGYKAGEKDLWRMRDMRTRAKGSEAKLVALAKQMANSIKDPEKAFRRADAAIQIFEGEEVKDQIVQAFMLAALELQSPLAA